jgi:hypothetical protein
MTDLGYLLSTRLSKVPVVGNRQSRAVGGSLLPKLALKLLSDRLSAMLMRVLTLLKLPLDVKQTLRIGIFPRYVDSK